MRYGAKVLFEDVSTAFSPGKRYGLTGPNGAGKSTFMKLLTGELDAQKGTVVRPRKLGVLSQDQFAFDAYRVVDTVIMGNKRLWAALEERDKNAKGSDGAVRHFAGVERIRAGSLLRLLLKSENLVTFDHRGQNIHDTRSNHS